MRKYQIVDYTKAYYEKLIHYFKRINPEFSDTYIRFIADNGLTEDDEPSILVVDENDEIIGSQMYYYTKAELRGEVVPVKWGHDTFLEKDWRKYAGLDLMLAANKRKNGFGIGISDVNRKIQKKLKTVFYPLGGYQFFNFFIFSTMFQRSLHKPPHLDFKKNSSVKVKRNLFRLVNNVNELNIPNNGYWNHGDTELDFVRDANFMDFRFFHNPIHDYNVYRLETSGTSDVCFFVVRIINYNGVRTLFIVDYRYQLTQKEQLHLIIKAAKKLAFYNHCGMTYVKTSDQNLAEIQRKSLFIRKRPSDLIVNKKFNLDLSKNIIVTSADSDEDYHK